MGVIIGEFAMKLVNPNWIHPIKMELETSKSQKMKQLKRSLLIGIYKIFGKKSINPSFDAFLSDIDLPEIPIYDLRSIFSDMSDTEYDFMIMLLKLNPKERPSYRSIFSHSYFNGFTSHEPVDMTILEKVKTMDQIQVQRSSLKSISDFIYNILDTDNTRESYFLAIMIFDTYVLIIRMQK